MTQINWAEGVPSINSAVGQFPRFAESVWTAISQGLGTSIMWDGSGGQSTQSAGDLRPGAPRAYVDVQSNSSTPNSQATGRALLASDTSRLIVYDSSASFLGGTPYCVSYQSTPTQPYGWVELSQITYFSVTTNTQTDTQFLFGVTFLNPPTVYLTWNTSHVSDWFSVGTITTTGFFSKFSSGVNESTSTTSLNWMACGLAQVYGST